jgi:hypothetical protein
MTTSPGPSPDPPDQSPGPRTGSTWTRAELAAQIQRASPAQPDQPPQPRPAELPRTWTRAELAARIRHATPASQPPAQPAATSDRLTLATPAPPTPENPARRSYKPALEPWWIEYEGHPWIEPDRPASRPSDYRVVLALSPLLRGRHPELPLSLEEVLNLGKPPPEPDHHGRGHWTEMYGTPQEPARARAIIRDTLTEWGLADLAPGAERLAADLVADAAQYSAHEFFGLSIDEYNPPGQPRYIRCSISGASPQPPTPQASPPGTRHGTTTDRYGTSSWFTLTSPDRLTRTPPDHDHELEPGA